MILSSNQTIPFGAEAYVFFARQFKANIAPMGCEYIAISRVSFSVSTLPAAFFHPTPGERCQQKSTSLSSACSPSVCPSVCGTRTRKRAVVHSSPWSVRLKDGGGATNHNTNKSARHEFGEERFARTQVRCVTSSRHFRGGLLHGTAQKSFRKIRNSVLL